MAARFEPPVISDNPTGWGPSTIPAQFKDMVRVKSVAVWTSFEVLLQQYHPFSRTSRFRNLTDWGRSLTGLAPPIRIGGGKSTLWFVLERLIADIAILQDWTSNLFNLILIILKKSRKWGWFVHQVHDQVPEPVRSRMHPVLLLLWGGWFYLPIGRNI